MCLIPGFVTLKMTKVPEGKQDNADHLKASPLSHPLQRLHPLLQSSYMAKSKDSEILYIYIFHVDKTWQALRRENCEPTMQFPTATNSCV